MNEDTTTLAPVAEDLAQETDALEALRAGLRRYFAALGPDEAKAFDALLAEGGL
ncbi:hypothetical protein [Methylobacterium nonmethylotrophicum]|uniref:hypothetical protein n=1 Tax=Methylobacterium nonmethylotrophicum TaxID=1141884 RepID=UPI001436743B|nr:hypothetical protein [Methylobacterium nonmethylotrophicum]